MENNKTEEFNLLLSSDDELTTDTDTTDNKPTIREYINSNTKPKNDTERRPKLSKYLQMSPEERKELLEKARQRYHNLTPEEKEHIKQQRKNRIAENPEEYRCKQAEYRQMYRHTRPDNIRQAQQRYKEKNRDKIREYQREYYKNRRKEVVTISQVVKTLINEVNIKPDEILKVITNLKN